MRQIRLPLLISCLLAVTLMTFALPVRVLVTGDMHGWLESQPYNGRTVGGAAEMLAYWKTVESYTPNGFLVLGCGDFNTGPAMTTIYQGDPIIDVMNAMGYDACALGNHEFDYGLGRIAHWTAMAKFPLLAANMVRNDGMQAKNLALPYVINDEQGVKVGVIGLITYGLEELTVKAGAYPIQPYQDTLRKYVPEMRKQGAQAIIVVSHIPQNELVALAEQVADLQIPLMLGAHSHELAQRKVGKTWVVNSGEWWDAYGRVDLDYDEQTGDTDVIAAKQVWLLQRKPDADETVAKIIAGWKQRMTNDYGVSLGYTANGLTRPDGVYNFVDDCTLAMNADADVVLTNDGGLRQNIPPGEVTKATVISVMPFANSLTRISISGKALLDYLPKGGFIGVAGLYYDGKQYRITKTQQPVDPDATYVILLNSFMYASSNILKAADPNPKMAYADWRQPVYDWLAKHPTNKEHPLEEFVDSKSRFAK